MVDWYNQSGVVFFVSFICSGFHGLLMSSMGWFRELFNVNKPVVAMAHLPALPGTPRYDKDRGVKHIVEWVRRDVELLVDGGVDAIMFCNEDDRPYVFKAGMEQVTAMCRVITECKPEGIPFGVDFLWDSLAGIAIAHATEASFVRSVFTGVYESDMGLWSPDVGKAARYRSSIGGEEIRMFFNVVPEFASPLGSRGPAERAHSSTISSLADVILVSGRMAGAEADLGVIKTVKDNVQVPVMVNTGVTSENVESYFEVVDGGIIGSSLKEDGYTWNPVDSNRVKNLMNKVDKFRS